MRIWRAGPCQSGQTRRIIPSNVPIDALNVGSSHVATQDHELVAIFVDRELNGLIGQRGDVVGTALFLGQFFQFLHRVVALQRHVLQKVVQVGPPHIRRQPCGVDSRHIEEGGIVCGQQRHGRAVSDAQTQVAQIPLRRHKVLCKVLHVVHGVLGGVVGEHCGARTDDALVHDVADALKEMGGRRGRNGA